MTILNKFTIAEQIMETEDDDLLLQIKSLLETENNTITPIRTRALNDMTDQIEWYNTISPDLGKKYLNSVEYLFEVLQQNPKIFQIRYDDIELLN